MTTPETDYTSLALPATYPSNLLKGSIIKNKKGSVKGPYLRGPIPWKWITKADAAYPKSSIVLVSLALWHFRALNKSITFTVSIKAISKLCGIGHRTIQRCLRKLEEAGLLAIEGKNGSRNIYTLLDT